MQFVNNLGKFYRPEGMKTIPFSQCKVLAIGAHPDDIEIIGHHWAHQSCVSGKRDFFGIVVANGAGLTPRCEAHKNYSTRKMTLLRQKEQEAAARFGQYGGIWMLAYPSDSICNGLNPLFQNELNRIVEQLNPEIILTHNFLDAHMTHQSVAYHSAITAQRLSSKKSLRYFYGTEGWGDISRWYVTLDWKAKTKTIDCSNSLAYLNFVLGAFESQNRIMGYDEVVSDLLRARARLMDPYRKPGQKGTQVIFDMCDIKNGMISPRDYTKRLLNMHDDHIMSMGSVFS